MLGAPLLLKLSASSNDTRSAREGEAPSAKLTKLMTFENTKNIIYLDLPGREVCRFTIEGHEKSLLPLYDLCSW